MKNKGHYAQRFSMAAVIFLLGLTLTALLTFLVTRAMIKQEHKLALHTAEVFGARTEKLLDSLFHKTDILNAILVEHSGKLEEQTFQNLASTLDDGAGIRSVQCLPDGVVRYCYPLEGNEAVVGTSVLKDPRRQKDAMLAVETRSIALSGPYELYQGGLGLVARNPVFLTNEDGQEVFWGFTVIILDLPEALHPIAFSDLTLDGYAYRLHCIIDSGEEKIIDEAGALSLKDSVNYTIHVPNHEWTLSIAPEKGWINWRVTALISASGILFSALIAIIFYQWHEREQLRTEREQALNRLLQTDELTGFFNRRYLSVLVEQWCKEKERRFVLLYMDLDRFKQVNDTLGHHWGDMLLIAAAKRIADTMGPQAKLARIGGDEFVVIADSGVLPKDCHCVAGNLHRAFEAPFVLNDVPTVIGVSVGCVRFPEDASDYDSLMHLADQRMYEDKQQHAKERRKASGHV